LVPPNQKKTNALDNSIEAFHKSVKILVCELLRYKQIKEAVKFNDFNPLPSYETSSIRVSWRKPGQHHHASPSLRDFPIPLRLFSKSKSGLNGRFLVKVKAA